MKFSKDTFDLGILSKGEQKSFELEFKNTNDSAVEVVNFTSSCKCVLLKDKKKFRVPANYTGSIKVKVEADTHEEGEVFRSIALRTSEIEKPIKIATLKFRVI